MMTGAMTHSTNVIVSWRMRGLLADIQRCAQSSVTVLLQGETGTGKSSLARAIHEQSDRGRHPFVTFDCAAVASNLIESALFGHEKGAFTGAAQRQTGVLEEAGSGTLFIDELSELPLDLQPKLLRALEEREFSRVGDHLRIEVKCRIIAACQHDLRTLVGQGLFRSDLYFRLAVVVLNVPALRQQVDLLPRLVDEIFAQLQSDRRFSDLPAAVQQQMQQHNWPGNVRELRNHLERWLVMNDGVGPGPSQMSQQTQDLRLLLDLDQAYAHAKDSCVQQFERAYLERLMERAANNVTRAAQVGEINRRHLYDLLKKHGFKQ